MKILKLVLSLTVIAAVCAAVLAIVNNITKARIAENDVRTAKEAAQAVLPQGVKATTFTSDPADKSLQICIGYADEAKTSIVGYAVPGRNDKGYGGTIRLMVGLTPDGKVVTYRKLAANETPGLGAKLEDAAFVQQFTGKPAAALQVRKDGGEIDAITGATITSRAVCAAIADAQERIARVVAGMASSQEQKAAE